MKAAIYNSILTSNVDFPPAFCPTGNCTWPITPSVAVCGKCSSIEYQTNCKNEICYYTMPSGNIINLTDPTSVTSHQVIFRTVSNQEDTYTSSSYNDSQINRLYIAKFEVFGAPYDRNAIEAPGDGPFPWPNSSTIASECAIWMCVQSYNASQVDGNQKESITSEFAQFIDFNVDPHDVQNYTFLRPYSNYNINSIASDAMTEYLHETGYFDGSITIGGGGQDPSNDFVQAMWYASANPDDLNAWTQTLARSMTNVIRTTAPPSSSKLYDGKAYQLGIRIRWPWITLPVSLVLSSLMILITSIIKTARSPVEAWKSSPLSLLFMDVDRDIKNRAVGQAGRLDGLRKSTGKVKVAMRIDEQGDWMLKAV